MKKVLVIGSSGAGKSVFSRRLGEFTGLPVIHLDRHYWAAGWTEPPKEVWRARVEELLRGERWILDGNYGGTMELRLQSCDTVIFLDFSRYVCTWRVIKRVLMYYRDTRPDLADGCPEKFDFAFLRWVWNFPKRSRPTAVERISKVADRIAVHRLKSPGEAEAFLLALCEQEKNGYGKV